MIIQQLSVFLQNEPGRLLDFTKTLTSVGINISALNLAEVTDYGIVRLVVDNIDKAVAVLKENDYQLRLTDILCFDVTDEPGALNKILLTLSNENLNISYMYGYTNSGKASLVIKVDDMEKAISIFK